MDFESLKEKFLEQFSVYKTQVEDNEYYIRLKEKYDTLAPNVQLLVKGFSIFLVVYFFYSIPAGYVSAANEKLSFFEENRELTRDLIRAGRIAKNLKEPPPAISSDMLSNQIDSMMTGEQILPEQKVGVTPMQDVASRKLVPKGIEQSGVKATFKQLNLRQVIRMGESIHGINSSQLINIAVQADAKDPHFFNVDYEVASFSVPKEKNPLEGKGKKGKRNKRSRKTK